MPPPAPRPTPRWPTLLALGMGVLGVHLALLLGEAPWRIAARPFIAFNPASPPTAGAATPAHNDPAAATEPATPVPRAAAPVSTVRWIVPAALSVPQPKPPGERSARSPTPRAQALPKAKPQAPAAAPAPAPALAAAPAPAAEPSEPPTTEPGTAATGHPTPPEFSAAGAPGEELLAAATALPQPESNTSDTLPPAQVPASTQLEYAVTGRIKGFDYSAQAQLDWNVNDGRYSARMEVRVLLLGRRVQTSTGRVGAAGLEPERFADTSRSEKAAHFEPERQRIRFSTNAPEAVLLPGAQDRLSLFLQLASLLQARPQAYTLGDVIEMQVAGTGDADIWRFEVGDETTLSLPAGDMRVRALVRLPRKAYDSTVEMWVAPALQHLPVRLRVTQANGDVADQQLSRLP